MKFNNIQFPAMQKYEKIIFSYMGPFEKIEEINGFLYALEFDKINELVFVIKHGKNKTMRINSCKIMHMDILK